MQDGPVNPPGPTEQRNPLSSLDEMGALARNATALTEYAVPGKRNGQFYLSADNESRTALQHPPMNRRHQPFTLQQACQDAPTLARLTELSADSVARLKAIEPLIPAALRTALKAGPIEGPVWCLLVSNNAAAAKIRQLLPSLQAHLRAKGWEVDSIRLKVQITNGQGARP